MIEIYKVFKLDTKRPLAEKGETNLKKALDEDQGHTFVNKW